MARNANKKTLLAAVKKSYSRRSQWDRGVYEYAREIVENTAPIPRGLNRQLLTRHFLNGADGCDVLRDKARALYQAARRLVNTYMSLGYSD